VHPVHGVVFHQLPEVVRALHLHQARPPVGGTHLQQRQPPPEVRPRRVQERVVGNPVQPRGRVQHVGRPQERLGHQRGARVLGADQVLRNGVHQGAAQVPRHGRGDVLVHGAQHVLLAVAALQPQRLGGAAAALAHEGEPAGHRVGVQHANGQRRGPQAAVVLAQKELLEQAGVVPGAGGDRRPGGLRRLAGQPRGDEHEEGAQRHSRTTDSRHGSASLSGCTAARTGAARGVDRGLAAKPTGTGGAPLARACSLSRARSAGRVGRASGGRREGAGEMGARLRAPRWERSAPGIAHQRGGAAGSGSAAGRHHTRAPFTGAQRERCGRTLGVTSFGSRSAGAAEFQG
jgi:hypothetical protein